MPTKLLLAGYIGCGNLGDDAIALGLMRALEGRDFDFMLLSGDPRATQSVHNVPAVPRRDLKRVEEAIGKCDALVFPGGSIFQDVTSVRSVIYYSRLVHQAKKAGKKVVFLGQGVGPLNRFWGKRIALKAFSAADAIAVRDPASAELLKALGLRKPVRITADGAFLLPQPPVMDTDEGFQLGEMRSVGIAPRPWSKGLNVVDLFANLAKRLYAANVIPVMIAMDRHEDAPLILEINKAAGGRIPDIRKMDSPVVVQQRLRRMDAVLAMRLHAGILAATVGVPPLMVEYDPKVAAFAQGLGVSSALPMRGLTADKLADNLLRFIRERDRHLATVARRRDELTKLAQGNVDLLLETLGSAR